MKAAHWIQRSHLFRADACICSACGAACDRPCAKCPDCGMPMKKTKNEPTWADEAECLSALMDEDW